MAFGGTSSAQLAVNKDPNATDKQKKYNQQQQAQFAGQNGMAAAASQQATTATAAAPSASGSPVSATGQLQPSGPGIAPMAAPAPGVAAAATAASAPARTYVDRTNERTYGVPVDAKARQAFYTALTPGASATGGGVWQHDPQRGWYVTAGGAAPGGGGGTAGAPTSPWGPWPGMPAGATPPTWQAPDVSDQEISIINALQTALESGGSMGPDVVNMLRGKLQDDATSMAEQAKQRQADSLAGRGLNYGSPYAAAAERSIDEALSSDMSTGQREIDLAAATRNWEDRITAATALDDALGNIYDRADLSYGNALEGADANRENWGQEIDAWLGSRGLDIDQLRADITRELGLGGLAIDQGRLSQSDRQFDKDYRLRLAALLSGHELGLGDLGYKYTSLNSGLLNNILQGLR